MSTTTGTVTSTTVTGTTAAPLKNDVEIKLQQLNDEVFQVAQAIAANLTGCQSGEGGDATCLDIVQDLSRILENALVGKVSMLNLLTDDENKTAKIQSGSNQPPPRKRGGVAQLVEQIGESAGDLVDAGVNESAVVEISTSNLHVTLMEWNGAPFDGLRWPLAEDSAAKKFDSQDALGEPDDYYDESPDIIVTVAPDFLPNSASTHFDMAISKYSFENATLLFSQGADATSEPGAAGRGSSDTTGVLVSSVVSIQVSEVEDGMVLPSPIQITFNVADRLQGAPPVQASFAGVHASAAGLKLMPPQHTAVDCVWWDFDQRGGVGGWNSEGCEVASVTTVNETRVVCSCSHLTHFGVLFNPDLVLGDNDTLVLEIITYVGIGLSVLCLVITFLVFACVDAVRDYPKQILMNLVFAIALQQLLFIGVDKSLHPQSSGATRVDVSGIVNLGEDPATGSVAGSCQAVAFLLHYAMLAVWAWMVLEACHLYELFVISPRDCVQVREKLGTYSVIGWLGPLLFPIIGIAVWPDSYGSDTACWITNDGGAKYLVFIPFAVGWTTNLFIFSRVVWEIHASVGLETAS